MSKFLAIIFILVPFTAKANVDFCINVHQQVEFQLNQNLNWCDANINSLARPFEHRNCMVSARQHYEQQLMSLPGGCGQILYNMGLL